MSATPITTVHTVEQALAFLKVHRPQTYVSRPKDGNVLHLLKNGEVTIARVNEETPFVFSDAWEQYRAAK